jgi:anti-anti-sigma regulatory factor
MARTVPIRRGEQARSRLPLQFDRARLADDLIRESLSEERKALCVDPHGDRPDQDDANIAWRDFGPAVAEDRLEVRGMDFWATRDGMLDIRATVDTIARSRDEAVALGSPGLTFTATMPAAIAAATGVDGLIELEEEIGSLVDDGMTTVLWQYDPHGPAPAAGGGGSAYDVVDIPPELAPLVHAESVGGALTTAGTTLRLTGELDYMSAETVGRLLDAHCRGRLRVDASDLGFVDLLGMRALRGKPARPLTIIGASPSMRRLVALLGWAKPGEIELVSD